MLESNSNEMHKMNAASDEEAVTSVGTRVYLIMLYKQSGTKTLVASASTTPKLPVLLPLIILSALVLFILPIFSNPFCTTGGCRSALPIKHEFPSSEFLFSLIQSYPHLP